MDTMERPWSGLATIAPRRDLWPLIAALGGPDEAACAEPRRWVAAGLPLADADVLAREPAWPGASVRAGEPGWPACCDGFIKGPVALQFEGELSLLSGACVGVVGARACTPYGRLWSRRIAAAIAGAGGVVVSGLAAGIDCEAHLAADGPTIAVLGQGLAHRMPDWQARARATLLERGGLVVSEFAPQAPPDTWTFPVRNRIIAALSRLVVVVEAGLRSGARNTAGHALDRGRDVLAVPGPLEASASAGCLALLAEGAGVVTGVDAVLHAAGLSGVVAHPVTRESLVLGALQVGSRTPAEVAERTGLAWNDVGAALGAMVVEGSVIRLPGQRYRPA